MTTNPPAPSASADAGAAAGLQTPTQEILAGMWAELLEIPVTSGATCRLGISAAFLVGATLVARIRDRLASSCGWASCSSIRACATSPA